MNKQDVELFVIRADGAYLWNPSDNTLSLRYKGDLREAVAGRQAFAAKAPVSIVLVTDGARFGDMPNKFGLADAAYVSQNICLIASAEGWACCPRATMDIATLKEKLGLSEKEEPVLNNVVGYKPGKK
jgi:nitroreductase